MIKRSLAAAMLVALSASPAFALSDIVGEWAARQHEDAPERGGGPDIGEYQGLPLNAAARRHAETWSPSLLTVPEHQCPPHPADYGPNFSPVKIWKDVDPVTQRVVAYHTQMAWNMPVRTIWMDGRKHPPKDALHTWEGFSTGRWEGDMLVVDTTHLKPAYVRRNGVPRSDLASLREYFIRVDDVLTWVSVVTDPVYLTEPLVHSRNFQFDPGYQMDIYGCSVDIEIPRPEGEIPHYVDQNPDLNEFAQTYNLPLEAVRGGAATTYPEFQSKLKSGYQPPKGASK